MRPGKLHATKCLGAQLFSVHCSVLSVEIGVSSCVPSCKCLVSVHLCYVPWII